MSTGRSLPEIIARLEAAALQSMRDGPPTGAINPSDVLALCVASRLARALAQGSTESITSWP